MKLSVILCGLGMQIDHPPCRGNCSREKVGNIILYRRLKKEFRILKKHDACKRKRLFLRKGTFKNEMLHLKKKQKSTHNVYVSVALKKGVRIFLRKT